MTLAETSAVPVTGGKPPPPVEELRVPGLALGVVAITGLVGVALLRLPEQRVEFVAWALVGVLTVAATVTPWFRRNRFAAAESLLAVLLAAWLVVLGILLRDVAAVVLGLLQSALFLALRRSTRDWLVALPAAILSYVAALPLIWWSNPNQWLTQGLYPVVETGLGLYLVIAKMFRSELRAGAASAVVRWIGAIVAGVVLGYAALHIDPLFGVPTYHHWSFYVGPAELIRQGAIPLWEVPSQYGFLDELVIAWLPFGSAWQSAFALNALLNFIFAMTVFLLLRAPAGDAIDQAASLLISFALVFARISYSVAYAAVQAYPSTGGMRFVWALLLLLVAVRAARRAATSAPIGWLVLGTVIWTVGCLWSVESAFYCTITWLPAFAVLGWRAGRRLLLLLPAGLGLLALGVVVASIAPRLHGLPDFGSYFDFATTYAAGSGSWPLDLGGPVWLLVIAFGLVTATLRVPGPQLPVSLAAAGLIWATASYFVGRSHSGNIANLMAIIAPALLVALRLSRPDRLLVARQLAAAILTVVLVGNLAYQYGLVRFILTPPLAAAGIDSVRPVAGADLEAALKLAGVSGADPVAYIGQEPIGGGTLMPVWTAAGGAPVYSERLWLPLAPLDQLSLLPSSRRELYLDRFRSSHPGGGWLIESDRQPSYHPWLHDWLDKRYRLVRQVDTDGWLLSLYAPA